MEKVAKVKIGGKLGDFIHCLQYCHHLYTTRKIKSHIFLDPNGEPFERGAENTFKELVPIVLSQEYAVGFSLDYDNTEPADINLSDFRKSQYLYKSCWSDIVIKTFFGPNEQINPTAWIRIPKKDESRYMVVCRVNKLPLLPHIKLEYEQWFSMHDDIRFLGSQSDYDAFPMKHRCKFVANESLEQMFQVISDSSMFIGNQSSPLAIASSLNVYRVAELHPPAYPDGIHYGAEKKYFTNIKPII